MLQVPRLNIKQISMETGFFCDREAYHPSMWTGLMLNINVIWEFRGSGDTGFELGSNSHCMGYHPVSLLVIYHLQASASSHWAASPFTDSGGGGLVTQSCPTLATPWTEACQVPLSMGFFRQEYWSGLPFPSPSTSYTPWKNRGQAFRFLKTISYIFRGKTIS